MLNPDFKEMLSCLKDEEVDYYRRSEKEPVAIDRQLTESYIHVHEH